MFSESEGLHEPIKQRSVSTDIREPIASRDFITKNGLCRLCRSLFSRWPGWPQHFAWSERYPGDLILPVQGGFQPSTFIGTEGCLPYQHNSRSEWDYEEGFHPIHRTSSQIAYHECRICYLIHTALRHQIYDYGSVDMGIFPFSKNIVRIFLQVKNEKKQPIHTCLRLDRLVGDPKSCTPILDSTSTGDKTSLKVLQNRLNSCLKLRSGIAPKWAPTRLIEVIDNSETGFSIRLVHSEDLPFIPEYMTLSHRWGGNAPLTLTNKNLESFQKAIPWVSLPKTFLDGLVLTHRLGFSYMWIDCLCIIQDSESDWNTQSVQMSEVYSYTVLNVYADCAKESRDGFFRRRDIADSFVFADWPRMPGSLWHCRIDHGHVFESHRHGPASYLGSRGWIVQEEMLAAATAYFGESDIFWICHHGAASESLSIQEHAIADDDYWEHGTLGDFLSTRRALWAADCSAVDRLRAWNNVTAEYNACDLTFEKDKVVAISAIAKRFCNLSNWATHEFIAGHWRSSLIESIYWKPVRSASVSRYDTYVAPSWSWMSVKGSIWQDHLLVLRARAYYRLVSEIVDAEISTEVSRFGRVLSGHIDIRGPMWKLFTLIDRRRTQRGDIDVAMMACEHSFSAGHHDCHLYLDLPPEETSTKDGFLDLFFLPIRISASAIRSHKGPNHFRFYLQGLLLKHLHDQKGQYRRLGHAHVPLTSIEHEGCIGHDLPAVHYLRKHDRSITIPKMAEQILHQHIDVQKLDDRHSSSKAPMQELNLVVVQKFVESITKWKLYGSDFWPMTDLEMVRRKTFMESEYTVRIV